MTVLSTSGGTDQRTAAGPDAGAAPDPRPAPAPDPQQAPAPTAGPAPAAAPEAASATTPGATSAPALPVPALVLVAALAAAAVAQGGYHRPGQLLAGAGVLAALALALRRTPLKRSDQLGALMPALALLACWAVARAVWAGAAPAGLEYAALLAGVAAVLLVCRRVPPGQRGALADALVAVGALIALTAWLGVANRMVMWAWPHQGLWRAAATLTYANATAGLLAPLALVALARRADRPRSPLHAAGAVVLLLGIACTMSRGGTLAFAVGFLVLGWRLGPRRLVAVTAGPLLGAALAFAAVAPSLPERAPAGTGLAAAGLVAGLGLAATVAVLPRRLAAATVAAVVVAALAATVVPAVQAVPAGFGAAGRSISDTRLTTSSAHRADEALAALRLAREDPVAGKAPGEARLRWRTDDGHVLLNRYVHNEYLQVLAELGALGLLPLLVLVLLLGRMVARGREATGSAGVWAGVLAALAAFAVHSGFDFLWHLPALPLTVAALAGLACAPPGAVLGGGAGRQLDR